MTEASYLTKPDLPMLPQIKNRITFLYLEHCKINSEQYSILITDTEGIVHLPVISLAVLLLGPGTSISHQAIELIADAGITIVWVGEAGVRYYASGRPMTHSSDLLMKQAALVSNTRSHIKVARMMYQMRFPDEDVSSLTMQQLRGREGSRIRKIYREASKKWGVEWNGRDYDPEDFSASDEVNQALSTGNACLYGLAHAVIVALGCSAGLGFVHVGHEKSFVYDIADLYKAEITIPIAFEIASQHPENIGHEIRCRVRDELVNNHILERMVNDIHFLLSINIDDESSIMDEVLLWNGTKDLVKNGINYAKDEIKDGSSDNI
ncbi:MAG: type I-E CRISPR-associated endonuclease Cas1e [Bacillota bacterium]|nr:type I-E CRISPR-associated endonuclease Cas1e [Bacillota bacterium]